MSDRQCSSCGGICKKSGCERENIKPFDTAKEITRLRAIETAARNLIAVKGRNHTEQAYKMLEESLK